MKATSAVVLMLLVSPLMAQSDDQPVAVSITPATCMAPCNVRLAVHVQPEQMNREVTIEADSPLFYRSSTRPLEGESGPRRHELVLVGLPAGTYEVRVTVDRSSGGETSHRTTFQVHDHRR